MINQNYYICYSFCNCGNFLNEVSIFSTQKNKCPPISKYIVRYNKSESVRFIC